MRTVHPNEDALYEVKKAARLFQMIVWTLVLGIIVVSEVLTRLMTPKFDGTSLALMGISSGTYLGFKVLR